MMKLIPRLPAPRGTPTAVMLKVHCLVVALGIALLGQAPLARADIIIDFENTPSLPQQPDNYAAAGPMQTYTQAGVFSISGGVVLGNPSFVPQFAGNGGPFGSAPNLYGTEDIADPSLQSTIKLTLFPSQNVTAVTGALFNAQPFAESYTVTAFSGATQVGTEPFLLSPNVPSPGTGSAVTFSLSSTLANPITEVDVTTPNADTNGWDFLVDSIHVTTNLQAIPELSTMATGGTSVVMLCLAHLLRRRRKATA